MKTFFKDMTIKTLTKDKKFFLAAVLVIVVFVVFVAVIILPGSKSNQSSLVRPSPLPVTKDFSKEYSKLNLLTPGKSTLEDVEKVNGSPLSASTFGGKTTLTYQTPSDDYKNTVVIKNGTVSYALDNVFGEYKGTYDKYVASYGQPDMALHDDKNDADWFVFLKRGFAVQSSANQITALLYFAPSDKNSFLKTIGKDLSISGESAAGGKKGEQLLPNQP